MNDLIEQLLSGPVIQRRESGQQQDGLGSLMGFLSQGGSMGQAPALPAMGHQGSGIGSAILKQFVADKMEQHKRVDSIQQLKDIEANSNLTSQQKMMAMAQNSDPNVAQSGLSGYISSLTKDPKNLQFEDIGVKGASSLIQKVRVNSDGSYTPFGFPRTQSSGVHVNIADKFENFKAQEDYKAAIDLEKENRKHAFEAPLRALNMANKQQTADALTQDQGQANTYAKQLKSADEKIAQALARLSISPVKNPGGFALDVMSNIPGLKAISKTMQSDDQQLFKQQSGIINANVIHAMTGAGYSHIEGEDKADAYTPQWGDSNLTISQKASDRDTLMQSLNTRAGKAGAIQDRKQNLFKGRPLKAGWVLDADGRLRKQ